MDITGLEKVPAIVFVIGVPVSGFILEVILYLDSYNKGDAAGITTWNCYFICHCKIKAIW